jgi:hypothetical protein
VSDIHAKVNKTFFNIPMKQVLCFMVQEGKHFNIECLEFIIGESRSFKYIISKNQVFEEQHFLVISELLLFLRRF